MAYPLWLAKLLVRTGIAGWIPSFQRLAAGGSSFLHHYSDRALGAPHDELSEAAVFQESYSPDVIDLAQGSPRFDFLPSASTKLPADRRGMPPLLGLGELREAVADKLKGDYDLCFDPADEVLITAGVTGAFHIALEAFVNPGDKVVLFDPASPMYRFALHQHRARIAWLPTHLDHGRTCFAAEDLVRALRGARLIVVNSPANPTGSVLAEEDLEKIAWWAARRDVLIFADEVFERFLYDGDPLSIAAQARAWKRTLIAGSVSKGHALASARAGWLVGHRHLLRPCAMTAMLQGSPVPVLSQQLALSALQQEVDTLPAIQAEFNSKRRYVFERLQALELDAAWPAGGFFFWMSVAKLGLTGKAFAQQLLHDKKVLVWPGEHFGPSGRGHIRISYAGEDGRLREGLTRLAEFVRELRAKQPNAAREAA